MNTLTHDQVTLVSQGDQNDKRVAVDRMQTHKNHDEVDLIDLLNFFWRIRNFIIVGSVLGLGLGFLFSLSKLSKDQVTIASNTNQSQILPTLSPSLYQSDFLVKVKDPSSNPKSTQLNDLKELLALSQTLNIYYQKTTQIWTQKAANWQQYANNHLTPIETFRTLQNDEKILSFQEEANDNSFILSIKLPNEIGKTLLDRIILDFISDWNKQIIGPAFARNLEAEASKQKNLINTKVAMLNNKMQLSKLYYNLIKQALRNNDSIINFISDKERSVSEKISIENAYTLVGLLSAENLLTSADEEQYFKELIKLQTQLESLMQAMNQLNASKNKLGIAELSLAPPLAQIGLIQNQAVSLLSKKANEVPSQAIEVPAQAKLKKSPLHTMHWSVFLCFGLFIGLLCGALAGAMTMFLKNNWSRIIAD